MACHLQHLLSSHILISLTEASWWNMWFNLITSSWNGFEPPIEGTDSIGRHDSNGEPDLKRWLYELGSITGTIIGSTPVQSDWFTQSTTESTVIGLIWACRKKLECPFQWWICACRGLGVSSSSFYCWFQSGPTVKQLQVLEPRFRDRFQSPVASAMIEGWLVSLGLPMGGI
jgi:hypothetical protein